MLAQNKVKSLLSITLIAFLWMPLMAAAAETDAMVVENATPPATTETKPVLSNLVFSVNKIALGSDLDRTISKMYEAYEVSIENAGPNTVDIITAEVTNGANGQDAFQNTKRNTAGRAFGYWLFTGGIGAAISASRNSSSNSAARQVSRGYDNAFSSEIMPPGSKITLKTFVPLGNTPRIRVTYKDKTSSEILYATK